ncbi:MAG: protein-disulfide reductase DsbD N-terminal domain-containing protein, partial [Bacteroidetes bacterium]|nr:protein-disulfide reductase DsbD N-terminal domain-containing protein [Bacteroidota bacterium]MBU1580423.1 protein-disulfide reductase DsbD N-terminal domain-containing protein [Bacteroidota bacterium]
MKHKIISLVSVIILLMPNLLKAQILEPVSWNFTTEKISDDRYNLVFTADIEPKWHLYSQNIPMSPPATTFSFTPNEAVEFIGKVSETESVEQYDPNFDMVLRFFSGQAVFKQEVRLLSAETVKIDGVLEFMSCDDMRCLPPSEVDFSFRLKGEVAATIFNNDIGAAPQSQVLDPVKWSYDVKTAGSNQIELIFKAKIDEGYHLYSVDIPENGPL